jgi:hypothetical protein
VDRDALSHFRIENSKIEQIKRVLERKRSDRERERERERESEIGVYKDAFEFEAVV